MDILITTEKLRRIALGKIVFKKCPCCDNNGRQYWEETGTSVLPYPHPNWGDDYESGPCDNCEGVGYIMINAE